MANVNKFKVRKAEAELLDILYRTVEEKLSETHREYKPTQEQEQDKDWRTGELLWEDEEKTIPKMKNIWAYVDITEEDMDDDRLATVEACKHIMAALEKLI